RKAVPVVGVAQCWVALPGNTARHGFPTSSSFINSRPHPVFNSVHHHQPIVSGLRQALPQSVWTSGPQTSYTSAAAASFLTQQPHPTVSGSYSTQHSVNCSTASGYSGVDVSRYSVGNSDYYQHKSNVETVTTIYDPRASEYNVYPSNSGVNRGYVKYTRPSASLEVPGSSNCNDWHDRSSSSLDVPRRGSIGFNTSRPSLAISKFYPAWAEKRQSTKSREARGPAWNELHQSTLGDVHYSNVGPQTDFNAINQQLANLGINITTRPNLAKTAASPAWSEKRQSTKSREAFESKPVTSNNNPGRNERRHTISRASTYASSTVTNGHNSSKNASPGNSSPIVRKPNLAKSAASRAWGERRQSTKTREALEAQLRNNSSSSYTQYTASNNNNYNVTNINSTYTSGQNLWNTQARSFETPRQVLNVAQGRHGSSLDTPRRGSIVYSNQNTNVSTVKGSSFIQGNTYAQGIYNGERRQSITQERPRSYSNINTGCPSIYSHIIPQTERRSSISKHISQPVTKTAYLSSLWQKTVSDDKYKSGNSSYFVKQPPSTSSSYQTALLGHQSASLEGPSSTPLGTINSAWQGRTASSVDTPRRESLRNVANSVSGTENKEDTPIVSNANASNIQSPNSVNKTESAPDIGRLSTGRRLSVRFSVPDKGKPVTITNTGETSTEVTTTEVTTTEVTTQVTASRTHSVKKRFFDSFRKNPTAVRQQQQTPKSPTKQTKSTMKKNKLLNLIL
ncbi:unnamed protein product, partial [Meganyctiphanes norvegica]